MGESGPLFTLEGGSSAGPVGSQAPAAPGAPAPTDLEGLAAHVQALATRVGQLEAEMTPLRPLASSRPSFDHTLYLRDAIQSELYKQGVAGWRGTGRGDFEINYLLARVGGEIAGWVINPTSLSKLAAGVGIVLDAATPAIKVGDTAGVHILLDGANKRIRSSNFVAGSVGFNIGADTGDAEFNNLVARGLLKSAAFETDTISAVGGSLAVLDGDALAADMTALDSSPVTILGNTTLSVNDVLRMKDGIDDEWLKVTAATPPTYTVARDQAAAYAANANPAWKKGQAVVNYGVSGEGGILMSASIAGAPFFELFTHAGSPWSALSRHIKLQQALSRFGSAVDAPSTTALVVFHSAQTYNGEAMGAGDVLLGDNSAGKANILWDKSAGRLHFRGGTTLQGYIETDGAVVFGAGSVRLDNSGFSLLEGDTTTSTIRWQTAGNESIASVYGNIDAASDRTLVLQGGLYNAILGPTTGVVHAIAASKGGGSNNARRTSMTLRSKDLVAGETIFDLFQVRQETSTRGFMRVLQDLETVFNEDGSDQDFRVEGDTIADVFVVDAGKDVAYFRGIGARVYHSVTQNIPSDAWTTLTFNSERYDTDAIHDLTTNPSRLTSKTAGKYEIGACVGFESNATGLRVVVININGTPSIGQNRSPAVSGGDTVLSAACVYELAVNDYVEVRVYQNSGVALLALSIGNVFPEFWMQRIG